MKFKVGEIIEDATGKTTPIVVKTALSNKPRDILIGGGAALFGIIYLAVTAFKNGIREHEYAETEAMIEAGMVDTELEDGRHGLRIKSEEP